MDRRDFLRTTAASAAIAAIPKALWADDATAMRAQLTLQPGQPGQPIAKDFLGLSFETRQLVQPEFFSAQNASLGGFFRALGTGVLRIGGNSSEFAFWTPSSSGGAAHTTEAIGPDTGHYASPGSRTTPQAIRNLRTFLDMTDWRAIYGLNLGKGTPSQAADEAAFVSKTLGDRLICFQIGNEADLYRNNGLRPKNYAYPDFARDWTKFHDAVKARVSGARFAGPDTAGTGTWVEEFAQQFGSEVMFLSTHYYAEGPASDPSMNIERLLGSTAPRWKDGVPKIRQAMAESHLPYRLTETNSCFGGGKAGVSNTFASSLWALELMLQLTALGGSGINFHAGGYGWYAPIVGTVENGFVARPEYYAMLLFSQLPGSRLIASHLDSAEANPLFVAYALTGARGKSQAVVINKDAQKDVRLAVREGSRGERISIQRLIAPRLDDEQDTTLAAAPIGASGAWKPERIEHASVRNGAAECLIPAGSAALLNWE